MNKTKVQASLSRIVAGINTEFEAMDDTERGTLLANLTIGVLEVLAGVREADQLARWLGEDAFRALVTRSNLSARARSARGVAPARPSYRIVSTHVSSPADGVVEGVVITAGPTRTRAVAVRLEGWDGRWRATSLAAL